MFTLRKFARGSPILSLHRRQFASINQDSFGNPLSVLRYNGKSFPSDDEPLQENEIQLKVAAAVILPEDVSMIRGESHIHNLSDFAGLSSVGTITRVGSNVKTAKAGDQALIFCPGAWNEAPIVSSSQVITISKSISPEIAATFPIHISAWAILHHFNIVSTDGKILQASPNTPVGLSVSSMAKMKGLTVVEPTGEEILKGEFVRLNRGKFQHIVSGLGGKTGLVAVKALGEKGKMISFKGKYTPLIELGSIDIPVASAIFNDAVVEGFDLYTWIQQNPSLLPIAVKEVENMILSNSSSALTSKNFALKQYQSGIEKVVSDNDTVVLTWP